MGNYQPSSRRPIAGLFRKTAHGAVRMCIQLNIHPDAISYLSVVAAFVAMILFLSAGNQPWMLLIAPVFLYLRLYCNMLDGMVALESGKASHRGEIINELPDRVSDVLIFVGIAHSGLMNPFMGYWTAILALIVAYVGTLGDAVAGRREFGGLMSKQWRMVVLHLGAWGTLGFIWWGGGNPIWSGLSLLDWTCILIILGCLQTILVRLKSTLKILKSKTE